jgi:hypothetical protein
MRYQILILVIVFSVSEAFALNVTMSTKIEGGDIHQKRGGLTA